MTQTVSQAVAIRDDGDIVKFMWTSSRHLSAVLPEHVDVKSFLGTAAAALHADPKLMAAALAKPDTLMTALFRCAALGHQPGTDEYYLTIRKGGILGIEGYRGVIERMYRSGAVKSVIVREVCAKDKFKFVEGDMDKPSHHFGGGDGFRNETGADFFGKDGYRDRGPMVGVYAYAVLMTGAVSRVVLLNRADVMAAKEASDASESPYSPWNRFDAGKEHPEFRGRSMWWKTGAKRLEPWVPTSAEYRRELMRAANAVQAAAADLPAAAAALAGEADDILEAEIVEPQIPPTSPGKTEDKTPQPAPAAQVKALAELVGRLPFKQDSDVQEIVHWLTGRVVANLSELTRSEVAHVKGVLTDHVETAKGDSELAVSKLWDQYHAAKEAANASRA